MNAPTRPAGTTAPAVTPRFSAGVYYFRTVVQTAWLDPVLGGAFGRLFTANARLLVPGMQATSAAPVRGAVEQAPAGIRGTAPARWWNIQGSFTATQPWNFDDLNRAIARSFAQDVTRWEALPRPAALVRARAPGAPRDGATLHGRLRGSDACAGGADYSDVYARACTRVEVTGQAVVTPIGRTAVTPIAPPSNWGGQQPPPAPPPSPASIARPAPAAPRAAAPRPAATRTAAPAPSSKKSNANSILLQSYARRPTIPG